jgi:metallo-beta-lactamase family protein
MLRDSAYLQQRDMEWVNKIRARRHEPPLEPLYTIPQAEACMNSFAATDYDTPFTIAPGITVTLREGGHILGSAGILLEVEEKGATRRVGFTGDIGRPNMPIIQDPNLLRDLDILIMESTYGNRTHADSDNVMDLLAELVTEAARTGGKVIIPAFAVGRTQLLVYLFHRLFNEGRMPDMPIFVDSPLALHATHVFQKHAELFDRETRRIFLHDKEDPFVFERLKYIETVEDSKKLNGLSYPHIIISSSGMAEGGRILHHLRNTIGNHRNLVLFVGYAARETLARKMMDGERKVKIFGEEHTVRCRVATLDHFSAHADRGDLLKYVGMTPPERLNDIFLIHGEPEQMEPLRHALRSQGYGRVHMPEQDEEYTL